VVGAHAGIIRAASAIARTAAAPPAETGRSAAESHAILDYRGIDHVGWDTSYRTGAARACAGAACARSTRSTSAASHEHMRIANGNSKNSAVQLHTPRSPSLSTALKPMHARTPCTAGQEEGRTEAIAFAWRHMLTRWRKY
jgi:hypothetical protein